jgi:hypothetical protein
MDRCCELAKLARGEICKNCFRAVSKRFDAYQYRGSAYKMRGFWPLHSQFAGNHGWFMSSPELVQLDGRHDLAGLRIALDTLCSRYGRLSHLTILPANHVGRQQALCFLRMASIDEEESIMTALGIGRFGGELVLVVNLRAGLAAEGGAQATSVSSGAGAASIQL